MAEDNHLRDLVAEVAAAYFWNSHVPPAEIPTVVQHIATSLAMVGTSPSPAEPAAAEDAQAKQKLTPAQIRKSITPDALISFEDGKPYKTLRRHLATKGLGPVEYVEKWGLPKDYPMVAPNYSAARSAMAKASGLGALRKGATSTAARSSAQTAAAPTRQATKTRASAAKSAPPATPETPKRRGRKPRAASQNIS